MALSLRDKIFRRAGHIVFEYEGRMCIWGGFTERVPTKPKQPNSVSKNENDIHSSTEVFCFDPFKKDWSRMLVMDGDVPPRTTGACGTFYDERFLFVFGGRHGYEEDELYVDDVNNMLFRLICSLDFRLDMKRKSWRLMPKAEKRCHQYTHSNQRKNHNAEPPIPCEKSALLAYGEYLYLFGGYGPAPEQFHNYPVEPLFDLDPSSSWSYPQGWNASVHRYCIKTESWEWIPCKGQHPSPRCGHGSAICSNHLIIFGGRNLKYRTNDIYALNLNNYEWIRICSGYQPELSDLIGNGLLSERDGSVCDSSGAVYPEGRSLHSFTRIPDCGGTKRFLVYGGVSMLCCPLNDGWILNLDIEQRNSVWEQIDLSYDHGEVRCWHTTICMKEGSEVIVHSGCTQEYYSNRIDLDDHAEDILTFEFGVRSLGRISLEFIIDNIDKYEDEFLSNEVPWHLCKIIRNRVYQDFDKLYPLIMSTVSTTTPLLDRKNVLHKGI